MQTHSTSLFCECDSKNSLLIPVLNCHVVDVTAVAAAS